MVKANELRIGNLIEPIQNEVVNFHTIVLGILSKGIYIPYNGVPARFNEVDFNPIPLTEEWLTKLGFTKKRDWYWLFPGNKKMFKNELSIHWNRHYNFAYFSLNEENGQRQFGIENKHVHQLQNLYFYLTGEELIYKP